eukprot:NODE_429_length_2261_cov_72.849005_g395_i0.p1 GENE.NODE_429_length_2261_cov_72.849005_g395_i0~~NODE_429_length_2261_cov_72.849005_g395_i0.p1  ORF type:complete len:631 (+),score=139.79 NODE_429_length_2261_cov_72.849005_g395_i0:69-1961(+)
MSTAQQPQNASLYVGDLPLDVTEAMLFDLFKAVGPVLSIRVCRDAVTRRSLGYAYVNFQSATDAERALETLNYHQIKGKKPIRIMWSHRDPGLRKSGSGNVFIKNLHKSIDNQTLYDTFSQFGNILSCKVATDYTTGESRGYGFVHFESEDSAKAAIEKVNGMLLKSLQVFVGRFVRRSQRQQDGATIFTNVFVKDLKQDVTESDLQAYFGQFGAISSMCLRRDKKGRPFAFVDFGPPKGEPNSEPPSDEAVAAGNANALKAIEATHDKVIPELSEGESKVYAGRAQKLKERQEELKKKYAQMKARRMNEFSGSNLFVKNLDDSIDDQMLREAFERFGEISSCKVMLDDKIPPVSKGFGFVCFKDPESANKAIAEMNGHLLIAKPLYVNVAQRKEVRRATLEIQYAARLGRMTNPAVPQSQPGMGFQQMFPPPPPGYYPPPTSFMGYPPGPAGRGVMGGPGPKWQSAMPGMGFPASIPPQFMMRGAPQAARRPASRGAPSPSRAMPTRAPAPPKLAAPPQAFVYNKQARNKEQVPLTSAGAIPPVMVPGQAEPLTTQSLANMTPEQQKNTLGERLFTLITRVEPDNAAKITGMLLEMDVSEILMLLESGPLLNTKIAEALEVLKNHPMQQ